MSKKSLQSIEEEITKVKKEIQEIGQMRPGSLTRQYKNPKDKTGLFYQLSYTSKMKSKTEYIRPQFIDDIRLQINAYKRFRILVQHWIELAIEYSREKMDIEKRNKL